MMKKYIWMVIVVGILATGSLGAFSSSVAAGIVMLLLGGGLIALFFIILVKKKNAPQPAQVDYTETLQDLGDDELEFKVAGVSFANDDGRERQDIIKEIRAGKEVDITLEEYSYKGRPAIGVYADGEQIGNVPADTVSEVLPVLDSCTVEEYEVLGSGKEAPFGFLVKISF